MDQASKIIAINIDPNAPIFDIAHYKIVGDLNEVIPRMVRVYREAGK
jgi:electron transfer flavoprotein alpha subunit